jgi:hypothetical protein
MDRINDALDKAIIVTKNIKNNMLVYSKDMVNTIKNIKKAIEENKKLKTSSSVTAASQSTSQSTDDAPRILKIDYKGVTKESAFALSEAYKILATIADPRSAKGFSVEQVKSIGLKIVELLKDAGLNNEANKVLSFVSQYRGASDALKGDQTFLDLTHTIYEKMQYAQDLIYKYNDYKNRTTVVTSEGTSYRINLDAGENSTSITTQEDPKKFLDALAAAYKQGTLNANSR